MPRWLQPQLPFPTLRFLPRRKKMVKVNRETFRIGNYKQKMQPPLGIVQFGQRAARGKIARKRKAS